MAPQLQIGDAFGMALKECYDAGMKAGIIAPIIERDDGFIQNDFDGRHYFAVSDEWSDLDRWVLEGVSGRVLDIGAGAGRAAICLQERGCDAVALDVSPLCVEICRDRSVRATFTGGVEEFAATKPAPFDAFVLFGNGLGLLRDAAYAVQFLDLLASIARPGAVIVGGCLDPYRSGDPEHLAYHEQNRAAGRMAGQIRIRIRHRSVATPWWEYLFMSIEELRGLVEGSRWQIEAVKDGTLTYAVRMRLK
jgi:SAM-dependent methyltransferase